MKRSIVIATSSDILNKKIFNLLHRTRHYDIIDICNDGQKVQKCLQDREPELAILSLDYKDISGISITGRLKEANIQTRVALMVDNTDITLMRLALEYGVMGYFLETNEWRILECLDTLHHGEYFVETELYQKHYFSKLY